MPVELPSLPYPFEALEPHLDAETLKIHHGKHHKAYVDGYNKAEEALAAARAAGNFDLVQHYTRLLAFHGGGHFNHTNFWQTMAPANKGGGGEPTATLLEQILMDFGSFEKFKAQFQATAVGVEGNGWAWLVWQPDVQKLGIQAVMNHQYQTTVSSLPLVGVDVWEHAYYLKYRNLRADFVTAWWNVVNWPEGLRRFNLVRGTKLK
ncbi:MAG: superoxide dismutase [Candidatus Riflebacteria bacterium]|nr:superoxide dismutase [Candidatus Riflebacteria bacterium]